MNDYCVDSCSETHAPDLQECDKDYINQLNECMGNCQPDDLDCKDVCWLQYKNGLSYCPCMASGDHPLTLVIRLV